MTSTLPLTPEEKDFLTLVLRREDTGDPVRPYLPISKQIQNLIDRGWLKTDKLYCIMGNTGELGLSVTEAGRIAMEKK